MEIMVQLFNVVLMIFIVSTMAAAGLGTTFSALSGAFKNVTLLLLVLLVNLILVPLIGWGTAALLGLAVPSFVALVLLACSPGAPFGAKIAMIQKGDVVIGSSYQVLLAAIGSFTFPITANLILSAANLGEDIALPVADLVKTVVILQLLPFGVGLALRNWAPDTAKEWRPWALKISNLTFMAVLALGILGSWRELIGLIGSLMPLASVVFTRVAAGVGTLVATGKMPTRTTVGLMAPTRSSGPVLAAVAIAFSDNPQILASVTAFLLIELVVVIPIGSYLAKQRTPPEQLAAASAAVDA